MKSFKSYLLATIGLAVLVGSLVFGGASSSNAAPGAQDVRVVNNVDNPVPTRAQGTTNIAGTVAAAQSGSWNVGIAGNTAATPMWVRDVDGPTRQPFQAQVGGVWNSSISIVLDITVPAGKRLVIKHVSASTDVPSGQFVQARFLINNAFEYELLMTSQGTFQSGDTHFVASQPVEIVADPGTNIHFAIDRSSAAGGGFSFGGATVSGYLVDAF